MIRLFYLTLPVLAFTAACSGPVETRIKTHSVSALPEPKLYSFAPKPEQGNQIYKDARTLVAETLKSKGFQTGGSAPLLVNIALANRPASISLTTGSDANVETIAEVKEKKLLQSCKDQEHRLTIAIIDQVTGDTFYSGTAAEYHCKGTMADSMPFLVRAALSQLGNEIGSGEQETVRQRAGIE